MITFSFGHPEALQQSCISILMFSLVLIVIVGAIVYKSFGVNKWATLAGGVLVLTASATFSSVNLSRIFYQLQLDKGAMIMMLGHGFVSSGLFILIGSLYERYHTRNIRYYGGLYKLLPRFGTLFLLFVLFDIGVPGSPAFVAI